MARSGSRILLTVLIVALVLPFGCEKRNESPVGYGELNRQVSDPMSLPIGSPLEDTAYSSFIPTGSATGLLTGSFQGYEARAVLRFEVSDTQVVNNATKAKLRLRRQNRLGTGSLDLDLCVLGEPWKESWATWSDADSATPWMVPGGYVSDTIASSTIAEVDSVTFTILGPELASVIDTSNNGLIVIARGNAVADFSSRETSAPPLLFVHYFKDGAARIDTIVPLADAFLIYTDYQVPDGRLVIGNGHPFRSLLKFDLSAIPQMASINYGILTLTIDTAESSFQTMELTAHRVTGEWTAGQTPFGEQTYPSPEIAASDSSVQIDIALLLQDCISGEDFGFLLKSASEFSNVSRIAFFSSETDSLERPHLVVYYTLPPGYR